MAQNGHFPLSREGNKWPKLRFSLYKHPQNGYSPLIIWEKGTFFPLDNCSWPCHWRETVFYMIIYAFLVANFFGAEFVSMLLKSLLWLSASACRWISYDAMLHNT